MSIGFGSLDDLKDLIGKPLTAKVQKELEEKYIELQLVHELDDVSVSLSEDVTRGKQIELIMRLLSVDIILELDAKLDAKLKNPNIRYSSGALYNQP
jgi:hypothetical protein